MSNEMLLFAMCVCLSNTQNEQLFVVVAEEVVMRVLDKTRFVAKERHVHTLSDILVDQTSQTFLNSQQK